ETFPGLHDGAAKLFSFHGDRTLQAFENNHGRTTRTAVGNFGTCQRRISLRGRTLSVGLMADLAVCSKNFLAALGWRKLSLSASRPLRSGSFFRNWRARIWIKAIAAKTARVATEISATE